MAELRRAWLWIALELVLAGSLFLVPTVGHTQIAPTDEYPKLIAAGQSIQPMGTHPFGESVNLYNGSLSFEVTDVSAPGIGPVLQLSRSLDDADPTNGGFNRERPFGEWHLDIPRMETMTAFQGSGSAGDGSASLQGWWVWTSGVSGHLDRCTQFRAPPPAQASQDYLHWDPTSWWYGYFLIIPGEGSQYVGSGFASTINGVSYSLGTKKNWRIGCGVTASDGGEGFLAVAPDGTRYTFNHLIYRPATSLERTDPLPPGDGGEGFMDVLTRRDGLMYVTKIEDRFGNILTYNWSSNDPDDPVNNHLTSIVASDGRELDLAYYSGTPQLIHTVTVKAAGGASARTWTYYYDTSGNEPSLTKVQLPDGSTWIYQLGNLYKYSLQTDGVSCPSGSGPYSIGANGGTGSATAPSGLTATFTVTPMFHGRSYVRQQCNIDIPGGNPPQDYFPITPDLYGEFSLTKEVLSGPGIATATWTWSYSPPNASWTTDPCASGKTCATTVYTDVTDPLGHVVRYTFSNRFDFTEGQLLRTDSFSGAVGSADLRSVVNAYADPTGQPWPTAGDIDVTNINSPQIDEISPLQNSVITQDGATFATHANAFDNLARATSITESSSLGYSKTDTTSYQDDTNLWVLGLVTQTATNGIVVTRNSYDSLDQPTSQYAFGRLVSTNAWNANGTLASIKDGGNHTTNFSTWYRGVPAKITYADGTSQSATVDGNGWITSVTDENGYTTNYGYDAMGRLASVTYPSGDDVAWNPTSRVFEQINSSEYNIPAGHWRLTETTGNGIKQTFYDAFWRPLVVKIWDAANFGGTVTKTITRYDADGRLNFQSYPDANVSDYLATIPGTHTSYDALDRVITVQRDSELGTLTSATQYLSGFQTKVTDSRGYATTTSYQAYGEPIIDFPDGITAPEGQLTVIMRDAFGKPLSITRTGTAAGSPQITRYYVYDGYQQLCKRIDPESGATAFGHDNAGNVLWSASGLNLPGNTTCDASTAYGSGRRVDRTYDARNRLLTLSFPDGNGNQTWSYYPDGLPKAATANNSGGVPTQDNYSYDKRRLLTRHWLYVSSTWIWTSIYTYDANGHLASEFYPNSLTVTYAPNALGQPTQVGSYAAGAHYNPDGTLASFTYGNGIVHTLTENTRGLPSATTDSGGGVTPMAQTYTYDADGDLTALSDSGNSQQTRTMSYDGLDRLAGMNAASMSGQYNYSYDVLDNLRVLVHVGGSTNTYNYDSASRLTSITNPSYPTISLAWDVQGNLATKGGQGYGFDYGNRLRWVAGQELYSYDAWGRRVQSANATVGNINSIYNREGQLLFQKNDRDTVSRDYLYLGKRLVAIVDYPYSGGSSVRYQHTDYQGTVVAQTDASRGILSRNLYDSWGTPRDHGNDDQPGYTGHVQDSLTGLTYMQQRYYDPTLSRFLSVDPVGADSESGGNFNRYWYANDNPYRYTDPDGRQTTGEFIDQQAQAASDQGNYVATYLWAFAGTAWNYLGAESVSQVADKGAGASTGDKVMAAITVVTLGKGEEAVAAVKDVGEVAAKEAVSLTSEQAKNVDRFAQKVPANAKDSVSLKPLPNGGVAAQATSPGKNVGSAVYEKQIDSTGKTIQYTKTTYDQDGHIVHVKDKLTGETYGQQ